jgi:cytidine deaminase
VHRKFKNLLIVSEDIKGVVPCGARHQVFSELCGDIALQDGSLFTKSI